MTHIEQDIFHVLLKSVFEQELISESTYRYAQNQICISGLSLYEEENDAACRPNSCDQNKLLLYI